MLGSDHALDPAGRQLTPSENAPVWQPHAFFRRILRGCSSCRSNVTHRFAEPDADCRMNCTGAGALTRRSLLLRAGVPMPRSHHPGPSPPGHVQQSCCWRGHQRAKRRTHGTILPSKSAPDRSTCRTKEHTSRPTHQSQPARTR